MFLAWVAFLDLGRDVFSARSGGREAPSVSKGNDDSEEGLAILAMTLVFSVLAGCHWKEGSGWE
jgi:hypothetical protein